jgi:cytochrome c
VKHLTASALIGLVTLAMSGPATAQDAKAGKTVFERCIACHTVAKGDRNRAGPNLWGVFGSTAGQREIGYKFSAALTNSGLVWNEETISAYLENPRKVIPKTRMTFPGMKNPDQRANVIAYLRSVTQ